MGCGGSKLDDLPAVELCRNRTQHLSSAIHFRYALADAHRDYTNSLCAIGAALHAFLDASASFPPPPPSPALNLPAQRKGDSMPPLTPSPPPQHHHSHSHSHSGSHIHFHSSDDDSDNDDDSDDSPLHHHLHPEPGEPIGPTASTSATIHYARNHPAGSSVAYGQRSQSPEPVYHYSGDPSSSSPPPQPYSYYPSNQNYNSYYPYNYPSFGGFFGSNSPPPNPTMASPPLAASSSSPPSKQKSPPPMPSPPRTSTWDFLDPFDYQSYYQRAAYTPSRSSKEVREEEGIPELEDEDQDKEVVKEAYVASSSAAMAKDEKDDDVAQDLEYKRRSVESSTPAEFHADVVVDKNVVGDDIRRRTEQRSVTAVVARTYHGASEIALEIKVQFERASDTAGELSKLLEVGKLPYHRRSSIYQATKMICMLPLSTSKDLDFVDFEEDKVTGVGSLSSSLQKLHIWECKLYEEILAEETMRVDHEKQCKRLKHLDEKGAEAYKLDATQAMIKKLSTKIRIAIQVIDTVSKKINNLRDDELLPLLVKLIQGFVKMWNVMLECHQTQCRAISGAKSLDSISAASKLSDYHMDVAMKLELEVIRWIGCFSSWTYAQKRLVKSLNEWLSHCLHKEAEVTADGVVPFSPGRVGAPPVFVICNHWSQIVDRISEKEVIQAMQAFATNVRHIWEQSNIELRQKMMVNKEIERAIKTREKEAQTMQRAVDALNKKLVQVSGQNDVPVLHQSHYAQTSSLQLGLKQVFEAIENFTSNSAKAYEDLQARAEEEMAASEDLKVS